MTTRRFALDLGTGALICALMGLLACSESGPIDPTMPVVAAAKGGRVAPPRVTEADPAEAPQNTSLLVHVYGSGFDDGSAVTFLLAGVSAEDKMQVHSTTFRSGTQLDVDLTITADAEVALYDIEVMTARGKKGIGTEKFSVKLNGPPPEDIPVSAAFRDASGDGVLSDGGGDYDAVLNLIGNVFLDARANTTARKLCMEFAGQPGAPADVCDDGYLSTAEPDITNGFRALPVGGTMTTRMQVTWVKLGYNWLLRFGMDCNDGDANRIEVTHPAENTWVLEGNDARLCGMPTKGRPRIVDFGTFSMPFQITLTAQQ